MIGKALVTGGAGFIGSALVDRLVDDGTDVLVIDDLSSGRLGNLADARRRGRVTFHQADILAPEIPKIVEQYAPEVVFHLAAQISVRSSVDDPLRDAMVNVAGTVNMLQASVLGGVARFVHTSSGGAVYGVPAKLPVGEKARRRPESPYGVSKSVADEYLRYYHEAFGLDYAIIGPANVYGPRQDPHGEAGVVSIFTTTLLARQTPVIFGDGSQTRDYVYVEDVVDAFIRAGERGGGRFYNIGTGRETSVLELFEIIRDIIGRDVSADFAPARPGDIQRSCLDSGRARTQLEWEPFTTLEKGLIATVGWFRSNG